MPPRVNASCGFSFQISIRSMSRALPAPYTSVGGTDSLDRAVRFDAHHVLAARTAAVVHLAAAVAAQLRLVRPEVADVVGDMHLHAVAARAPVQRAELGHQLAHPGRLDQHLPAFARASHRHGHADRPRRDARVDEHVEQRVEIVDRAVRDRRVHAVGMPCARKRFNEATAASKEPRTPRNSSCQSRMPSIEIPAAFSPAAFAAATRSSVRLRPPLCRVHSMPAAAIAAMICGKSRRKYASPPMSEISRVPSRARRATISRHSSVVSSPVRFAPAREPQWPHLRSQASVISHTTWTGRYAAIARRFRTASPAYRWSRSRRYVQRPLRLFQWLAAPSTSSFVRASGGGPCGQPARLSPAALDVGFELFDHVVDPHAVERMDVVGLPKSRWITSLLSWSRSSGQRFYRSPDQDSCPRRPGGCNRV